VNRRRDAEENRGGDGRGEQGGRGVQVGLHGFSPKSPRRSDAGARPEGAAPRSANRSRVRSSVRRTSADRPSPRR
jgi:hypothetical protein